MIVLIAIATIFLCAGAENEIASANEEACHDGLVDAATRTQDGSTYLFRGNFYWKIDGGIVNGYPRPISEDWIGVGSGPIDAALTWNDGSTFIFKGDEYWKFYNKVAEPGYPKKISEGFHGIPNNIDAALVWQNNGFTYFFKGNHYWRYRPNGANPTNGNYPRKISAWRGVPDNITAAIRWEEGRTYFFKDTEYYRYENDVQRVSSRYPIATSGAWFECAEPTNETFNYERENDRNTKIGQTELISVLLEIEKSIETLSKNQKETRLEIQGIKKHLDYLSSNKPVQSV